MMYKKGICNMWIMIVLLLRIRRIRRVRIFLRVIFITNLKLVSNHMSFNFVLQVLTWKMEAIYCARVVFRTDSVKEVIFPYIMKKEYNNNKKKCKYIYRVIL